MVEWREVLLSFITLIVAAVVSQFLLKFRSLYTIGILLVTGTVIAFALCLLSFHRQLKEIDKQLTGLTGALELMESLGMRVQGNLLPLIKKKSKDDEILMRDIYNVFVEPLEDLYKGSEEGFREIIERGSPERHDRIKDLMDKADREEITLEEAQELRKLLKEEEEERREEGDILGAIAVGALILSLVYLIARLLEKE